MTKMTGLWRLKAAAAIASLLAMRAPQAVVAQDADAIAAPGETAVLTVHAEGAQVYECAGADGGKLAWKFRQPIATLMRDGKTLGRHYAGPTWELADGSAVEGKIVTRAPGASAQDIPQLKLAVSVYRGAGALSEATTVQRINTRGGALEGACGAIGATTAVAYSADYVFLKR